MGSALHQRISEAVGERTYRAVADLTGTHPETVRRYLQGQSPSVEFLEALCSKLALSGEWLLTGRGPMYAGEVRQHALKQAAAPELLTAMASSLEVLLDRVERLERYTQSLEVLTRGTAPETASDSAPASKPAHVQARAVPSEPDGTSHAKPAPLDAAARARRIAEAIARRPREDAR
jgi:transcriptional regulator with XRE-family HTH domain